MIRFLRLLWNQLLNALLECLAAVIVLHEAARGALAKPIAGKYQPRQLSTSRSSSSFFMTSERRRILWVPARSRGTSDDDDVPDLGAAVCPIE